jgi:GxxExxY protein
MNSSKIAQDIFEMASNIYNELGGAFNEDINQRALALEFRESGIKYLREVHIEIFYKGQSLGLDRPDFIILPTKAKGWNLSEPIVLETKVSQTISNDHRQQLKSYFKSFPHNKNDVLRKITKGILLKFLKSENFEEVEKTKPAIELELFSFNRRSGGIRKVGVLPTVSVPYEEQAGL